MKKYLLVFVLAIFICSTFAQTKERSEIADKYKWDLTHLYKSKEEWYKHKDEIKKQIDQLDKYAGKLKEKSAYLLETSVNYENAVKAFSKLAGYASKLGDENLGISENRQLGMEVSTLGTYFSEKTSFIRPEITSIDNSILEKFYKENKELAKYKFSISLIQRGKAHTLSPEGEAILASAGMIAGFDYEVYSIFDNSEKPIPSVALSDGKEISLDTPAFLTLRPGENRADRKIVFNNFFSNYGKFINTLGANFVGKLKKDWFFAKSRKYNSTLESSLDANNIPVSVYENLISQINKNLPTLHRMLELKKKIIGVDTMHYYDIYTPLVKKTNFDFSVEKAAEVIPVALKPLGEEYVSVIKKAFESRWIDFYSNKGKRSGAYSDGSAYDVHPYILMNWTDNYESLGTMAHELGHTMHSYFSNKNQPYIYSDYSIFVAEIASTLNEHLLNKYMLDNFKSRDEQLFLLGSYLEMMRGTIFRQVQFAEFELEVHKKIEAGEPLTGEALSSIYYDIVKKYYGHDKGVCIVDPYIANEWAFIPHFIMSTYYVYQYSTSLIYSTAISEKILNQGEPAVKNYYNILSGGGSDFPIELIKKAGIDPLSSEAFDLTMSKINKVIDRIEELLKQK